MLVFTIGPVIAAFSISLQAWDLLTPPKFVGFANYVNAGKDPVFLRAILNTLYYNALAVPIGLFISLLLAIVLNRAKTWIIWLRTLYFLPYVTSTVAVALLWTWLYNYDLGILNYLLGLVGLPRVAWITDPRMAMNSIIIMSIWRGIGYSMVIFLAGLQNIPEHLYESAKIDGANAVQSFRYVTLPMLSPTTFLLFVWGFISGFQVFEQTYMLTRGGPLNATTTIVFNIWQEGFRYGHMGYASAMAWILFVIIFILTAGQWRLEKRFVHYQ